MALLPLHCSLSHGFLRSYDTVLRNSKFASAASTVILNHSSGPVSFEDGVFSRLLIRIEILVSLLYRFGTVGVAIGDPWCDGGIGIMDCSSVLSTSFCLSSRIELASISLYGS